jgi:hypothetical protein
MVRIVTAYLRWFDEWRPHQGLGGRTPRERFDGVIPAHRFPRLEPRARYPVGAPCAAPRVPVRGRRGVGLELVLSHPKDAPHLPIVALRRAA